MQPKKRLTIGLQVVSLSDAYNNAIIDAINSAAQKLDFNLILFLCGTPNNPRFKNEHHQRVIYNQINANNLDAVILLSGSLSNFLSDDEFASIILKFKSIPIVSIGVDISHIVDNQTSIIVNSASGLNQMINHLIIDHKVKNPAFISGPLQNFEAVQRLNAFKNSLKHHNIPFDENNVYYGSFDSSDGAPAVQQFLSNKKRPDAIICSNDLAALGVLEELAKRDIKVPEHISVTGFDDIPAGKINTPSLSTVAQPFIELGYLAAKKSIDLINKHKVDAIYTIDTTETNRESCGCKTSHRIKNKKLKTIKKTLLSKKISFYRKFIDKITNNKTEISITNTLLNMINNIGEKSDFNASKCIIEYNEYFEDILNLRIKEDLKTNNGHENWLESISNIEETIHYENKNDAFQYLLICIRKSLIKEKSLFLDSNISTRDNIYATKEILEEVFCSSDFESLENKLDSRFLQFLQYINLEKYVVLSYPTPKKKIRDQHWDEPELINVIVSFAKNKSTKNKENHPSNLLFPEHIYQNEERYTIVTESLYSDDHQIGRVLYELYQRETDLFTCSMINNQIASTVRNIHQNRQRKSSQKKINLLVKDLEKKNKIAEDAVIAKGRFLATMSHEIRTPMNGVLGVTELLKDTPLNTKQKEYLDVIKTSSFSLLNIISDILDYSKIEEGKLSIETIEFKLDDLCKEVLSIFQFTIKEKKINLSLSIDKDCPNIIQTDPTRLRQILINLIGNALKFTFNGNITLKIEQSADTHSIKNLNDTNKLIKFSVIDTGIGISQENIKKLFGAFTQADNSTTRNFGGTGLGLSISKSLAELMGGEIGVSSTINKGSTFWFTLISKGESENCLVTIKESQNTSSVEKDQFKGKEILIAEDNKVNQLVITSMIKKYGINTTVANNGQEAFDLFKQTPNKYDLIIMDFEMPIMDGCEATIEIRKYENNHNESKIPIIAITAHAMKEHRDQCINSGMNDHLSKPIDVEQLNNTFNRFLQ